MGGRNPNKTKRRVALLYPLAVPWMTMYVRGIMDYAQQHGGWLLTTSPPSLIGAGEVPLTLDELRGWPGHGVITAVLNKKEVRAAHRLGVPVVNLAATLKSTEGIHRVMPDHYAMGRLAAEHLLERGLRHLAYYGIEGFWFSKERGRGFIECAERAGVTCDVLELPRKEGAWANLHKRTTLLVRWLKQLPLPIGILAVQDYRARTVIEECERFGLRIPHDVAVVGMEDDPTLCEFCHPTLSSVSRNSWQLGYETATVLDRLMNGLPTPMEVVVPSDGVVGRQSTDTIAVEDPHLTDALHFVHDHLAEAFGIDQIVEATSISRRQLETRFRRVLGCSPLDYLSRKRVERAQQLLKATAKIKFHKIAADCGFSSVEQMRLAFKRVVGMTALEYREAERAKRA